MEQTEAVFGKGADLIGPETKIVVLDEEGHGMEITDLTFLINKDTIQLKVKSQ